MASTSAADADIVVVKDEGDIVVQQPDAATSSGGGAKFICTLCDDAEFDSEEQFTEHFTEYHCSDDDDDDDPMAEDPNDDDPDPTDIDPPPPNPPPPPIRQRQQQRKAQQLDASRRETYECIECSRRFPLKQNVVEHLGLHAGFSPYPCRTCARRFVRPSTLRQHCHASGHECGDEPLVALEPTAEVRAMQQRYRVVAPELIHPFECLECGKCCPTRQGIRLHLGTHAQWAPYQCPECQRRFFRPSAMRQHLDKSGHGTATDDIKAQKPSEAVSELLQRYRELDVKRQQATTKGVMKKDTQEKGKRRRNLPDRCKPYECLECGRRYPLKQNVVEHLGVVHADWSAYRCQECDRRFFRPSSLKRHASESGHAAIVGDVVTAQQPGEEVRRVQARFRYHPEAKSEVDMTAAASSDDPPPPQPNVTFKGRQKRRRGGGASSAAE